MATIYETTYYNEVEKFKIAFNWLNVSDHAKEQAYYFVKNEVRGEVDIDSIHITEYKDLEHVLEELYVSYRTLKDYRNDPTKDGDDYLFMTLYRYLQNENEYDYIKCANTEHGYLVIRVDYQGIDDGREELQHRVG